MAAPGRHLPADLGGPRVRRRDQPRVLPAHPPRDAHRRPGRGCRRRGPRSDRRLGGGADGRPRRARAGAARPAGAERTGRPVRRVARRTAHGRAAPSAGGAHERRRMGAIPLPRRPGLAGEHLRRRGLPARLDRDHDPPHAPRRGRDPAGRPPAGPRGGADHLRGPGRAQPARRVAGDPGGSGADPAHRADLAGPEPGPSRAAADARRRGRRSGPRRPAGRGAPLPGPARRCLRRRAAPDRTRPARRRPTTAGRADDAGRVGQTGGPGGHSAPTTRRPGRSPAPTSRPRNS